ncbi:MAG: hypothetical protein ABL974_13660 [Prosthecobacter sp.]
MSDPKDFFNLDPNPVRKDKGKNTSRKTTINDPEKDPLTEAAQVKYENLRQRRLSWSQFIIAQIGILLLLFMAAIWFYRSAIAPHLQRQMQTITQAPTPTADTTAIESQLSRTRDQIAALQKQIDAQNGERERTQARLQEMADRMALVLKQSSFVPSADTSRATVGEASQVAAMMPNVSPSLSELILLKERNRLSEYADKAIATGSRESLQALVDAMFDPAMKHLLHASQAEFRRVQNYYDFSTSIDPGYTLPLQELFKSNPVRTEADLTPAQLTTLLQDRQQTWENRLRCAYLLRASSDKTTNAALLKAIKEDPSLDVAKQAQTTFEKRVGRKFRLFDIPTIDAWWETQKAK